MSTGVDPDARLVVGVDLGGTKIAAALVDETGTAGPVGTVPTPARSGPGAVLDAVAGLVRDVVAVAAPGSDAPTLAGLGVGTAGVVDAGSGMILSATDAISGWPGTDVVGGLRERLADLLTPGAALPVRNDVDAHAAGEAWRGAAAGHPSALLVAVGTGVGAAVVLSGEPLRGAHHVAGEMGHMPSPAATGMRCGCGRLGHLEAIGSGPALHRHYLHLGGDPAARDARAVCARADAGEALAARAVRTSARAVGQAVAGIVTVVDPAVVVISGGMADAGPLWWDALEGALRAELVEPLADLLLVRSRLGGQAAILGAARGAWSELKEY